MENRYLFRGKRIDNGEWVEGYLSYPFARKRATKVIISTQRIVWVSSVVVL